MVHEPGKLGSYSPKVQRKAARVFHSVDEARHDPHKLLNRLLETQEELEGWHIGNHFDRMLGLAHVVTKAGFNPHETLNQIDSSIFYGHLDNESFKSLIRISHALAAKKKQGIRFDERVDPKSFLSSFAYDLKNKVIKSPEEAKQILDAFEKRVDSSQLPLREEEGTTPYWHSIYAEVVRQHKKAVK